MHADNATPKLPLKSRRKSAIQQCQQRMPMLQPGQQMRPNCMRTSCTLYVRGRTGRHLRLKKEAPLSLDLVFLMRDAGTVPRES
jgi:hypothetical protein